MAKLFGTDGIRGVANTELSSMLAYRIGQSAARILSNEVRRARILIARDTRISGKMLSYALTAGISSVGAQTVDVGVLPTPGAAHLVRTYCADAAIVISASHNSFEYNGIKIFNNKGLKLSDEIETEIENLILQEEPKNLPIGEFLGSSVFAPNASREYVKYLSSCIVEDVSSYKVVIDCANGAASNIAPALFNTLAIETIATFNTPDGININNGCGSTHPQQLQKLIVESAADVGFAFDGDADRLICVDEHGCIVDGDVILSICALDMKEQGKLNKNTVVGTLMTNLGVKNSLEKAGIKLVCTDVGDRYLIEEMLSNGYNLGGEQSGHMIFLDSNTTGDGILSALKVLSIMRRSGKTLSELAEWISVYPQILINVCISNKAKNIWQEQADIQQKIKETETKLGNKGRVLVRSSGTEPLLRVMIEGEDAKLIEKEALSIANMIEKHLDGKIKK